MSSFMTAWLAQIGELYEMLVNEHGTLLISVFATVIVILLGTIHYFYSSLKKTVIKLPTPKKNGPQKQRFRKRDKVKFFARKVLRKGKDTANKLQRQVSLMKESVSVPEYSRSGRRLRKRERMFILAKTMFRGKTEPPKLLRKELPASVLEPDFLDEQSIPEDVMYLLQTVKVFGHFEKGTFLQLCRHMESISLKANEYLFKVGDEDHWMYVVQEGQINLYIQEDNQETKLSEITSGESLHSLLSILDVLTGHVAPYKTVFAKAVKNSIVIRFPVNVFNSVLEDREDSLVQLVQVIMTRMQRVTFQALHNYLGLSNELLNPVISTSMDSERMSVHKLSTIMSTSDSSNHAILGRFKSVGEVTETKSSTTKSGMIKISSSPNLKSGTNVDIGETSSKSKLLRFDTVDRILDDQDNVFCRQTSLPENNAVFFQDLRSAANSLDKDASRSLENSIIDITLQRESRIDSIDDDKMVELNEPEILELVTKDLLSTFGIPESEFQMLSDNITLLKVPAQYELIEEGEQEGPLYFVVMGALSIYQHIQLPGENEEREAELFLGTPGMITGQLAMLTGEPSFFAVRSHQTSVIAHIARQSFYKMMQLYPRMVLNTAHTVVQRVSGFVRQIDFALDWMMVEAGKALYKQGSKSDCMYIVLHGRLRSVMTLADGKKELIADYGKGELIDMMEALRGKARPTSLHAVRDTELAKIPEGLVKYIRRIHPSITSHLMSLMSDKLLGNMMSAKPTHPSHMAHLLQHKQHMTEETQFAYGDVSNHLANLTNVAVVPVDHDVPLAKFTMELQHALSSLTDRTLRLNSDIIKQRLGQNALESAHEYRLCGWLAQQEDLHRIVLYQTDKTLTTWTKRCIRQADAILIVGMGDSDPSLGQLEEEIEHMAVRALKVLVLLHRPDVTHPSRTVEWLNMRGCLTDHLHIKGSKKLFARTRQSKLDEYWEKLKWKSVDRFSDFARLSRFLTGTSVALTLGGGGARGLSQTGIIKALLEAGTPIDYIGGTSMGAFMGALWACHRDLTVVRSKVAFFCGKMSSYAPQVLDLTYPISSMFSGSFFNKALQGTFKDIQIEDLWIPYYAVTTDVTSSKMRVHTDGMLWRYVRGSMSFTPALPPICDPKDGHLLVDGCYTSNLPGSLWRYVRGSMSLSGYVPPICDPKDGHLLVDGGYINNLPGDIARSRGARRVIAVDVGAATETNFTNYGDSLSGWWLLWKKWTGRWTGRVKIPDMNEIQSRLSYISCHYIMDMVMNSDYCTYIRPPVVRYSTLEFNKHAEIHDVGYHYGKAVFTEEWASKYWKDILALCNSDQATAEHNCENVSIQKKSSNMNFSANTSFMDLAEMLQQKKNHVLKTRESILLSDLSEMDELELDYDSSPEVYQRKMMQMESRRHNSVDNDIYLMGSKSFSDTEAGPSRSGVLLTSDEDDSDIDNENEEAIDD